MKRKAMTMIVAAAVTMGALLAGSAGLAAAEDGGSASAGVDVLTNYVWRGQKFSDDRGVAQPSVDFSYHGFGANYWANYDFDTSELTETDLTLSYSNQVEDLTATVGYIHYGLDGAADTQELFLSFGYDMLLSPAATLYYDFDEGEGAFLVLGIGHSFALPRDASVNLGATASVNFKNKVMGAGEDRSEFTGFYNGELSASVAVPLGYGIAVEPKAAWSFPLGDDARAAIESLSVGGTSSHVYGGVNISVGF